MSAPRPIPLERVLRGAVAAHRLGRRATTLDGAVRAAGGIYGANPTAHRSLAARVAGYTPPALARAEEVDRALVRVPAMRGSVYLLPPDLVPAGVRLSQRQDMRWYTAGSGLDERAYSALADAIEDGLSGGPPRSTPWIREFLGRAAPAPGIMTAALRRMGSEGRIVRAGVAGGVASQAWRYARGAEWVAGLADPLPARHEALRLLAVPWLAANGPMEPRDLAWWAGIPAGEASTVLGAANTVPVVVRDLPGDLRALPETVAALADAAALADPDEVHLVPYWDAWLMASRHRSRYLAPRHAPFVVDRDGNVTNVILRGGRAVGTWDLEGDQLLYFPFESLDDATVAASAEAQAQVAPIRDAVPAAARPLDAIGRGGFMRPLRAR